MALGHFDGTCKTRFFYCFTFIFFAGLCSAEERLLENKYLAAVLDTDAFSVKAITNKLTNETVQIQGGGFSIEVGLGDEVASIGTLTPKNCELEKIDHDFRSVAFNFRHGSVQGVLRYELDPENHFLVKTMELSCDTEQSWNVHRLILFDLKPDENVTKAIQYWGVAELYREDYNWVTSKDVQPQRSENSIAYFLRTQYGGFFTAISCDFFTMENLDGTHRLAYWPGWILKSGEKFKSEMGLLGVYERKGLLEFNRYRKNELKAFCLPNIVDAGLDRGEQEAFYKCVKKYLRPTPYCNWINQWSLGLTWDWDTPEAVAKFKVVVDIASELKSIDSISIMPPWFGLFREFPETGTRTPIEFTPIVKEAVDYLTHRKLKAWGVFHPGCNVPDRRDPVFSDRPDWSILWVNGKRHWNVGLSREYFDYLFKVIDELAPKDAGIGYDFVQFLPDYDTAHGYLPGDASLYPQWRNMVDLNLRIRKNSPDCTIGGWVGWIDNGPWLHNTLSMAHNAFDFNVDLHINHRSFHIDHMVANNLRLANFYGNNAKMLPMYISNNSVFHYKFDAFPWDRLGYQYSLLSNIATSRAAGHLTTMPDEKAGEKFLQSEKDFIDKWLSWSRGHESYYEYDTLLFGEPSVDGLDGYAYCKPNDGFFFIFNPGTQPRLATVPIGQDIKLSAPGSYVVKEIYPQQRNMIGPDNGFFNLNSHFVVEVPGQSVMAFEIKPKISVNPVLLGVSGSITDVNNRHIALKDISGEKGKRGWIGIAGYKNKPESISVNGKDVPFSEYNGVLLAKVEFAGKPLNRELRWDITRDSNNIFLETRFFVPKYVEDVLKSQNYPLPEGIRGNNELLTKYPWVDSSRFIVHMPLKSSDLAPLSFIESSAKITSSAEDASVVVDKHTRTFWSAQQAGQRFQLDWDKSYDINMIDISATNPGKVNVLVKSDDQWLSIGSFDQSANNDSVLVLDEPVSTSSLRFEVETPGPNDIQVREIRVLAITGSIRGLFNGNEVPVGRNMMTSRLKQDRCAGFYVEPKGMVRYGAFNTLRVSLTGAHQGDVLPAYIQNLPPQYTDEFDVLTEPKNWPFTLAIEAAEPFGQVPEIRRRGDNIEALLQIEFSSGDYCDWSGNIKLKDGKVISLWCPDWDDSLNLVGNTWKLITDNNKRSIYLHLKGSLNSRISISSDQPSIKISLRDLLAPVLDGTNIWQSKVLSREIGKGTLSFYVRSLPKQKLYLSQ